MKKLFILSMLLAIFSQTGLSQSKYTLGDVRNARSLIWFGLDFSQARFYGPFMDREKMLSFDIPAWNTAFAEGRFTTFPMDLKKLLGMNYVFIDLSVVGERNSNIDISDLFGNNDKEKPQFTEDKVEKMVKKYTPAEKDGIGLVIIVESFDKTTELANVWVTYFDPITKTVIRTRKYTAKAAGMGIKHWCAPIVTILSDIRKNGVY